MALPGALAAAKVKIKENREDPTGYLEASKVLLQMDRQRAALDICAHGLKRIKHIGKGYQALKKAHDSLQERLAPKKAMDPFTLFSHEVALLILAHFSFKEIISLSRTSRGWRSFVLRQPSLWKHLDLSAAEKKVRGNFVSKAINMGRDGLTQATLNNLHNFDSALRALVRHCPLRSLTLMNTGLQAQNLVDLLQDVETLTEIDIRAGTQVTQATVSRLMMACGARLEVLRCASMRQLNYRPTKDDERMNLPHLRTLDLTSDGFNVTNQFFEDLTDNSPSLEHLRLWQRTNAHSPEPFVNLRNMENLKRVELRLRFVKAAQLKLPSGLQELTLASSVGASRFFELPGPRDMRLAGLKDLRSLSLNLPGLSFDQLSSELFDQTSTATEKLTALTLHDTLEIKDNHVDKLLELKALEYLDISGSSITGVAVKAMVKAGLKELVAYECNNVGRDAIDWARGQGLKVSFGKKAETGGKKVRY